MRWKAFVIIGAAGVVALAGGRVLGHGGSAPPRRTFGVGDRLPRLPHELAGLVTAAMGPTNTTAVVVFSLSCGACLGEAIVWEDLQNRFATNIHFVGVAAGSDSSSLRDLIRLSSVTFPISPSSVEDVMKIGVWVYPTVLVLDSSRTVLFRREGGEATADLRAWLQARYGGGLPQEGSK